MIDDDLSRELLGNYPAYSWYFEQRDKRIAQSGRPLTDEEAKDLIEEALRRFPSPTKH